MWFAVVAVPIVVALATWRGVSYWEYSEGAYALTARMLLDGAGLYTEVVAAQPPPLFYLAALVLSIHDSLGALRAALAVPLAATGLLVAVAVWRLTASRAAAVTGGAGALLAPWTLHEGTLLMPETFAAPLLMGAALLAATPGRAWWAGALAALAASFKLAFALPLVVLGFGSVRRRAYALGAAVAAAVLWALVLATHGAALIDNVFAAQLQSGRQPPRLVAGLWAQATWNLGPLVLLAGLAWPLRRRARDGRLLLATSALAIGAGGLLLSLVKHGSYLNVLAVVEPPLVVLAMCSVWWLLAARRRDSGAFAQTGVGEPRAATLRPDGRLATHAEPADAAPLAAGTRRGRIARVGAVLAVALVAAQSGSLLLSPADPVLFSQPLSDAPHGRGLSSDGVRESARRLADCESRPWSRTNPFLAFVAGQPIPGGQPDRFIIRYAGVHAAVRERALSGDGFACGPGTRSRAARGGAL